MSTVSATAEHPSNRLRSERAAPNDAQQWFVVPAVCLILAGLSLPADLPVARFCQAGYIPKFVIDLLKNAETFGHSAGVALIVLTVLFLDPRGKERAVTMALAAIGGGMGANLVKLCVGRCRPQSLDLLTADLTDTFIGLFRLGAGGSGHQSFPSAHTATAVGLATALAAAYPRGRIWFAVLAILVGLQRIQTSAHFPSDVFAGAAVGWIAAHVVLSLRQPKSTPSLSSESR
ncbi:MAG: phosphatase PAP2 family protein [Planctomycetaceae bacterium]|nr:phosphatase PAP2 family protein [Planctomycetaceae bacterium]